VPRQSESRDFDAAPAGLICLRKSIVPPEFTHPFGTANRPVRACRFPRDRRVWKKWVLRFSVSDARSVVANREHKNRAHADRRGKVTRARPVDITLPLRFAFSLSN